MNFGPFFQACIFFCSFPAIADAVFVQFPTELHSTQAKMTSRNSRETHKKLGKCSPMKDCLNKVLFMRKALYLW